SDTGAAVGGVVAGDPLCESASSASSAACLFLIPGDIATLPDLSISREKSEPAGPNPNPEPRF
ncbi:MAG: hypothetical protein LC804_27955, partial [Acidobacteria bacterium]|nr:hypothetical protein [Acidobacteriota bacterium]